jgi:signal transduction histidine kinase
VPHERQHFCKSIIFPLVRLGFPQEDDLKNLRDKSNEEALWLSSLSAVGDMVSPVAHELHNIFNGIVLQTAIVSRDAPAALKEKLAVFRTLGLKASEVLRMLDNYRYALCVPLHPVRVNEALHEAEALLQIQGVDVDAEAEEECPDVMAVESDLARLLELLGRNARGAMAAADCAGPVRLRCRSEGSAVQLVVEDDGPGIQREKASTLFDTFVTVRPGTNALELAACRSIVRRFGAEIVAESLPGSGLRVTVSFSSA